MYQPGTDGPHLGSLGGSLSARSAKCRMQTSYWMFNAHM